MDARNIQIPEGQADMAEIVAEKKGLTLEEYVALLLRREVCDTSTENGTGNEKEAGGR